MSAASHSSVLYSIGVERWGIIPLERLRAAQEGTRDASGLKMAALLGDGGARWLSASMVHVSARRSVVYRNNVPKPDYADPFSPHSRPPAAPSSPPPSASSSTRASSSPPFSPSLKRSKMPSCAT